MSILFYRRPDYLAKSTGPINPRECQVYVERAKKSERAIPKGLSFEEVVENKALPPCSLPDFMDYLVYVEMNAENLQFYLWYQDYVRRWENEVSANDKALSPEWDHAAKDVPDVTKEANVNGDPNASNATANSDQISSAGPDSSRASAAETASKMRRTSNAIISPGDTSTSLSGMNFFDDETKVANPSRVPIVPGGASVMSFGSNTTNSAAPSGQAWQAFSIQPNRDEINQIILHYLSFDSPRELNLSHKDRVSTLHALQHTTHPSALLPAFKVVEVALRGQSHPNFIRWSICNGNQPRVFFVRTMGVSNTLFGFVIAILLTLSGVSRWWRILAAIEWFIGLSTLIAAYKGLCVILHATHMRTLKPWEDDISIHSSQTDLEAANGKPSQIKPKVLQVSEKMNDGTVRHLSTFGAKNSKRDSGDTEEWERAYNDKNFVKKIFDKTVFTQDEALRLLQDKIVMGANIWSMIITVILTIVFVALPSGNFF